MLVTDEIVLITWSSWYMFIYLPFIMQTLFLFEGDMLLHRTIGPIVPIFHYEIPSGSSSLSLFTLKPTWKRVTCFSQSKACETLTLQYAKDASLFRNESFMWFFFKLKANWASLLFQTQCHWIRLAFLVTVVSNHWSYHSVPLGGQEEHTKPMRSLSQDC